MIAIPLCSIAWTSRATWHSIVVSKRTLPDSWGAAIVSFFDGTSWVCQLGGVSSLRRVVDELKQTNQEGPRRSSTKSGKRAAEHGIAATVSK